MPRSSTRAVCGGVLRARENAARTRTLPCLDADDGGSTSAHDPRGCQDQAQREVAWVHSSRSRYAVWRFSEVDEVAEDTEGCLGESLAAQAHTSVLSSNAAHLGGVRCLSAHCGCILEEASGAIRVSPLLRPRGSSCSGLPRRNG